MLSSHMDLRGLLTVKVDPSYAWGLDWVEQSNDSFVGAPEVQLAEKMDVRLAVGPSHRNHPAENGEKTTCF